MSFKKSELQTVSSHETSQILTEFPRRIKRQKESAFARMERLLTRDEGIVEFIVVKSARITLDKVRVRLGPWDRLELRRGVGEGHGDEFGKRHFGFFFGKKTLLISH